MLERQRFTGGKGRDTERCVDDADCRGVSSSVVPRIEAVANRSSSTFRIFLGVEKTLGSPEGGHGTREDCASRNIHSSRLFVYMRS